MDVSIVVPLWNEEESIPELFKWIDKEMHSEKLTYEVIFVDDGSTDESWDVIHELRKKYNQIKGISFRRNYGKSAALNEGFAAANGDVIVTMDADLQDSPEEIAEMRRMILEDGFDLVSGWKKKRHDPLSKRLPSKLFNRVTRMMSGIHLNDFNCGLKAYRKDVVKNIEVYGEMHRYIPVLAKWAGFANIGEKVVQHQARKYGKSKFGIERVIKGFLDLLSLMFVGRFGKRPMHFFGTIGTFLFILGFVLFTVIAGNKVYHLFIDEAAKNIAAMSVFYIALTAMIIGSQLFLAGFLAELINRNSQGRNSYHIKDRF
jgi:glycosyltransferase involved in cell wall biosynthesis